MPISAAILSLGLSVVLVLIGLWVGQNVNLLPIDASANAFYRIGKAWQNLGDKVKAIAAFEKALSFKPELAKKTKLFSY